MAKPVGIHWIVLLAIGKAQGDQSSYIRDSEIAKNIAGNINDIRNSLELLETDGFVEIAKLEFGLVATITAQGRLALSQYDTRPVRRPTELESTISMSSGPSLWIEFDETKHCIDHNKLDFKDGRGPVQRTFVRLGVSNDHLRLARSCRVVLDRIEEVNATGLVPIHYPTPMRLLWAKEPHGENEKGRNIYKGTSEIVDLLYTDSDGTNHWIVLRDVQHMGNGLLVFNKRYRFWITATAEGTEPVEIVLDISCGPTRSDVRVFEPGALIIRSHFKTSQTANDRGRI
jgi:hypothetical protein